jgi:hypothetical protein
MSPPRDMDRDTERWGGPWDRDRDREGPRPRRIDRDRREEEKPVTFPSVISWFVGQLPAPAVFDGELVIADDYELLPHLYLRGEGCCFAQQVLVLEYEQIYMYLKVKRNTKQEAVIPKDDNVPQATTFLQLDVTFGDKDTQIYSERNQLLFLFAILT